MHTQASHKKTIAVFKNGEYTTDQFIDWFKNNGKHTFAIEVVDISDLTEVKADNPYDLYLLEGNMVGKLTEETIKSLPEDKMVVLNAPRDMYGPLSRGGIRYTTDFVSDNSLKMLMPTIMQILNTNKN